ncbi:hypothetical protein ACNSN2_06050 [Pseudoalteromonas sp. US3C1013]|uniref:hypothetical protein n=1 Tax=unclassified Pseudoalteromonas TaxID=194690 RepID=UPI003AB49B29
MDIYSKASNKLKELGIENLNSRPYDCAYSVLDKDKNEKKLIVVGFNGSNADLEWTNLNSLEHGKENPDESNVLNGLNGAWLSTTLPKRLISLPAELGFPVNSTIYTNAILLCSENANAIKKKAKEVGFSHVNKLIEKSLDFFEDITIAESSPELIICYSNSMNDLSASSILYERFAVSEIEVLNNNVYYKTFSFMSEINGEKIPVVCIRHMSRFKPCIDSIKKAWKHQLNCL